MKSVYRRERFNDEDRGAIHKDSDQSSQIDFLKKMTSWLKEWKNSKHCSEALSHQTFCAIISTNESFPRNLSIFVRYLQNKLHIIRQVPK